MNKLAIIIQGASTNVNEQKEKWACVKHDIIFSTWLGFESHYDNADNVIFSEIPESSPMNFFHQVISTYKGLLKAKELGYEYVLKLRSDLIPTNCSKFLELIDNKDFNFLAWQRHQVYPNCQGYLVDYLMSGYIDDMLKLWNINECLTIVPEVNLTNNFINNLESFSTTKIKYFLDNLSNTNNLFWVKRNFYLSECQEHYKLHGGFSNDTQYLNKNYMNFFK